MEANKTQRDITLHAEIVAIRNATKFLNTQNLSDTILYTSHEPCIVCSYVIRHSHIQTIVSGLSTGEFGGYSSKYPLLLDDTITKWGNPPTLINGILEKECEELILKLNA